MQGKTYQISAKLNPELGDRIDEVAKLHFNSKKSDLIRKALENFVQSYETDVSSERASPLVAEARNQAEYVNILLVGSECEEILRKEVYKV